MRKFLLIIALAVVSLAGVKAQTGQELVDICVAMSEGAKYLKDFQIKLQTGDPAPTYKQTIVLAKNTIYRFTLCNSKDYPGEAVFSLYDNNRLMMTSHNVATGEDHNKLHFRCSKTGVYHVFVQFKDGKEGFAVVMLSFVKNF